MLSTSNYIVVSSATLSSLLIVRETGEGRESSGTCALRILQQTLGFSGQAAPLLKQEAISTIGVSKEGVWIPSNIREAT